MCFRRPFAAITLELHPKPAVAPNDPTMTKVADSVGFPSENPLPNSALGSSLCTQCGLCCTGALHNFAVLEPEEVDFAAGLGLTLRTEGRPGFALPCPYLKNCACTIYASRPKVCAHYKCGLLEELEADSITLDAALAKVHTAKALVSEAASVMQNGMTLPIARARALEAPSAEFIGAERTMEMRLRLAITALSLYLDKHFKNPREAKSLSLQLVPETDPDTEMI